MSESFRFVKLQSVGLHSPFTVVTLAHALRLDHRPWSDRYFPVAFTGAGGKTTALFRLARDLVRLAAAQERVWVTATAHLAPAQVKLADHHFVVQNEEQVPVQEAELPAGVLAFTGAESAGRMEGVLPEVLDRLQTLAQARGIALLIEADGSRQRPLKAPAEHEPVLFSASTASPGMVVVVAGLSALGRPLDMEWVHRPERFSQLSNLALGRAITPESIARVLCHPLGGQKNIPQDARRVALLNQVDTPELQSMAGRLAERLLTAFDAVVVSSLQKKPVNQELSTAEEAAIHSIHEPIAGIVLAAGSASRFGQLKQLLDYHGEAFVVRVARTALEAGLSPVVVVVGAEADRVRQALEELRIAMLRQSDYESVSLHPQLIIVENPKWQEGQSSSIQAGLSVLSENKAGAALFLLADQPQIPASLIRALQSRHHHTLAPIIAPYVLDRRANPVLFDRLTFSDLHKLSGDVGGRALFSQYPIDYVPWLDASLLLDVDRPDDYSRLINTVSL